MRGSAGTLSRLQDSIAPTVCKSVLVLVIPVQYTSISALSNAVVGSGIFAVDERLSIRCHHAPHQVGIGQPRRQSAGARIQCRY